MPVAGTVDWDSRALALFFEEIDSIVLPVMASETADMARQICPVRVRHTQVPRWAKRGHVGVPGRLKASVQWSMDEDEIGEYADVAALWYGRFLDPPARQMHAVHPFLPTALFATCEGRNFYL